MENNQMCQACLCGPKHSSERMKNLLNTIKRIKSDIKLVESYLMDNEVVDIINHSKPCTCQEEYHEQFQNIFQ